MKIVKAIGRGILAGLDWAWDFLIYGPALVVLAVICALFAIGLVGWSLLIG